MVLYLIIVMRRMRRVPHYQATWEDWTWYLVGSAVIVLLLVGIRHAWDMLIFLAVEHAHSENKSTQ